MSGNYGTRYSRLQIRRQEAQERQESYNELSVYEKLARLDRNDFDAKRERTRLERQLAAQK